MRSKGEKITEGVFHVILMILALCAIVPFLIMLSSSLTSDSYLSKHGYQLIPREFSAAAYDYLWTNAAQIGKAYGITIFNTVIGTTASLLIVSMFAYPLSLERMKGKKIINFLLVFSMLFNGGLVPTYIMYTQYFHVKNTLFAYLVPGMLMSAMNVMLVKNYYTNSIPHELFESARLDGASESRILFSIVIPLSKPILATVGLMAGLAYWNDWYNGMLYISDSKLYTIQVYLQQILQNVQFLANNEFARNTIQVELPEVAVRMAVAIVAVLPILIVYPFIQKLFVRGIAAGAVKG